MCGPATYACFAPSVAASHEKTPLPHGQWRSCYQCASQRQPSHPAERDGAGSARSAPSTLVRSHRTVSHRVCGFPPEPPQVRATPPYGECGFSAESIVTVTMPYGGGCVKGENNSVVGNVAFTPRTRLPAPSAARQAGKRPRKRNRLPEHPLRLCGLSRFCGVNPKMIQYPPGRDQHPPNGFCVADLASADPRQCLGYGQDDRL